MRADEYREHNVQMVINHYEQIKYKNDQIVIVEHISANSPLLKTKNHIAFTSNDLFNKSRLLNLGANYTKASILIFADADILLSRDSFKQMCEKLQEAASPLAIQPFTELIDLTLDQTNDLQRGKPQNKKFTGNLREGIVFAGGIIGMNRSAFERVGGWDSGYEGWGVEDNAMAYKLLRSCETQNINGQAAHLYHPGVSESYLRSKAYRKNLKRFRKLIRQGKKQV